MDSADEGDILERYDDIPDPDDVADSLDDPELYRRLGAVSTAKQYGRMASRSAGVVGVSFTAYILLIKLPVVAADLPLTFAATVGDPVVAALITVFGVLWSGVGVIHLWGAWAFYRLRRLQNAATRRARVHGFRGAVVLCTGIAIAAVGVAYTLALVLTG